MGMEQFKDFDKILTPPVLNVWRMWPRCHISMNSLNNRKFAWRRIWISTT